MSDQIVSVDEYLAARKHFVKGTGVLMKASRSSAPSWNKEARTIRMVMSAEIEDRDRDIILQAGLSLESFLQNPIAPLQHRSSGFPVGAWTDVEKLLTGRPKRTEGTLKLVPEDTDEDADRLARHFDAGTIKACSIGFIPKRIKRRDTPEEHKDEPYYWPGFVVEEAELVECSPVSIPANPAALAKMAANGDTLARETIEDVLDNWVKHPETGFIIPRAEFEAAHKQATGERTSVVLPPSKETHAERAEEPSPSEPDLAPGQRERSFLRRAFQRVSDAVFGEEGEALITNAVQAELAAEQDEEARRAARAERLKRINEKTSALDARLSAKRLITESA